jgi:hypothetical protein
VRGGDELLAAHREEEVEDDRIEHVPGADLLLDHVEPRLLEVHRCRSESGWGDARQCRRCPAAWSVTGVTGALGAARNDVASQMTGGHLLCRP